MTPPVFLALDYERDQWRAGQVRLRGLGLGLEISGFMDQSGERTVHRRDFVRNSVVTSAGLMAARPAVADLQAQEQAEATRLKLSVLRVTLDEALDEELRGGHGGPCPVFQEGQEFVVESPYFCPEGFCAWAWADIRTFIQAAYFGAEAPQISCCTDGVRPVFFRIERMEA